MHRLLLAGDVLPAKSLIPFPPERQGSSAKASKSVTHTGLFSPHVNAPDLTESSQVKFVAQRVFPFSELLVGFSTDHGEILFSSHWMMVFFACFC